MLTVDRKIPCFGLIVISSLILKSTRSLRVTSILEKKSAAVFSVLASLLRALYEN